MNRYDAVVIGSGPNGLVAANLLLDAGWQVLVVEAGLSPGGAVRSGELTLQGFRHDLFSAFYPLAAASPVIARLNLEEHGLRWLRAPLALAHPTPDGSCAVIASDVEQTAASLEAYHGGDGAGWRTLMDPYRSYGQGFVDALLSPFPPLRPGLRLARQLGWRGALDLARLGVIPARRLAEEHFGGEGGALLLAGNALHTDLSPEAAGSGLFGWLLCGLAQHVGFPVPKGGSGELTASLVRRMEAAGGQLRCDTPVVRVIVRDGRAVGVRTADGEEIEAARAVLADVSAPDLYTVLLADVELPSRLARDLGRFQWDAATVKVDWALSAPIPWSAPDARQAGTVHVADDLNELSRWAADLATRTVPAKPFLLVGQQSMTDSTRQPPGAETAWAYTHVPRRIDGDTAGEVSGRWDGDDEAAMVERIEARMEERAPASAVLFWPGTCSRPAPWRLRTPTSTGAPLMAARRSCINSWCFARPPVVAALARSSPGCIWRPRPPIPAVACTDHAAPTRHAPRSVLPASPGSLAEPKVAATAVDDCVT